MDTAMTRRVWGVGNDYLAARAEALSEQVRNGTAFYIRATLLAGIHDDGFDWITFLHAQDAAVVFWTLDADQP